MCFYRFLNIFRYDMVVWFLFTEVRYYVNLKEIDYLNYGVY